ncbi:MAG: endolytic transglycosylase MltG [bacterium]|nr:endolytic transglycosylase MltG [bacterium]
MTSYKFNSDSRRQWHKPSLFVGLAAVLMAVFVIFGIKTLYERNLGAVNPSAQDDIVFVVQSGDTAPQVADSLKEKDLIRSDRAFIQYVRSQNLGEDFIAGTYRLKQSYDVPKIAGILTSGDVAMDLFTILPGTTLAQIRQRFIDEGFKAATIDKALDPKGYANHPALVDKPAAASLEGYLYPDSFQKIAETTPQTIIKQSLDEMAGFLTPALRKGINTQGLTIHQGITLASIIEQEVSKPEDRKVVSQVFLKRLKIDMQLGSDVTALYGAIIDKVDLPDDDVVEAMSIAIGHDSPYNTRIRTGMPPGPISNVSANSLQAVANPASTDYLYFVAGDDGKTYFGSTLEEHNQNVASYCKKLCN